MNFYQRMGILPLKKRVNRDKCSFATKQRMFGVFAIDEILRYRGSPFPASRTLCHPVLNIYCRWFWKKGFTNLELWITCSKSFVFNIKTIIPQIIYYALSHVFCCVLCLAGVHCGQRGSSVGRYSWSGRVSRPEDTGSFFSTNNSMIINNVLKFDLREVNNKVW